MSTSKTTRGRTRAARRGIATGVTTTGLALALLVPAATATSAASAGHTYPDFRWHPIGDTADHSILNDYMDDDVPAGSTADEPETIIAGG